MMMVMPAAASERPVFYRERASGMYGGAVFAAAQGMAELPFLFVQSVLYVVILYGMIQFEFTGTKILWFWLYMWLDLMYFTYMGMGVMNATPNLPAATASGSFFILLWMLFCGFLIYRKNIKPWYIWAYYFNPMTFIIYGCVTTQLGDITDGFISVGDSTTTIAQYINDTFSYEYDMRGYIVLILLGFIAAFRGLSYLGYTRMNFQRR
ncbi:hypothetical protein Agub_g74 [Astrephomene gubernaculifera]|uniref:ABC-2 type transporter transmembrane domain-containing protein n=1 Tax=Astrephomene gubernaculifera TaxID=47775 RepID=A0AAD3DFV2_9CHLO|nr:hypothetical protein Agub_g74 [Astrephomene gubernaculifera]